MNSAFIVTSACALAATLSAQGIQSGPEAGMKLTPVKVYASSGAYKGREFDAVAEIGTGPGALLFIKDLTRETAPIIRTLDEQAAAFRVLGFHSFTMMLSGDRTAAEQRVKAVSSSMNMINPMTVSLDGPEGPGNYALNRDATMTLVMVKDGVVTRSIAFTETGIKDAPMVIAAIEAIAGKLPKTAEARQKLLPDDPASLKRMIGGLWQEIAALKQRLEKQRNQRNRGRNMRRNPRRGQDEREMRRNRRGGEQSEGGANTRKKQLPGSIPDDQQMQGLLRKLIRVKTTEEIDAVFESIDKAVGDSAEKRQQMVRGFTRILGATTYGTPEARQRAQAYCDKHGKKSASKRVRRD